MVQTRSQFENAIIEKPKNIGRPKTDSKQVAIANIMTLLTLCEQAQTFAKKKELVHRVMKAVYKHWSFLSKHPKFVKVIKQKLTYFLYVNKWEDARIYLDLFGFTKI